MSTDDVFLRAAAYDAMPSDRHYNDLNQHELETFWALVGRLRYGPLWSRTHGGAWAYGERGTHA